MGTLTIRNLDDCVKQRLRERAAAHGVSMEQEARDVLRDAVLPCKMTATSGLPDKEKPWRLKASVEEILALGRRPRKPFDQKQAFDDLYAYLDDE